MSDENKIKLWCCKIGEVQTSKLPGAADAPLRKAVEKAYLDTVGEEAGYCFSGWGGDLDAVERAVAENRDPTLEEIQTELRKCAATELYKALKNNKDLLEKLVQLNPALLKLASGVNIEALLEETQAALEKADGK